MHEEEVSSDAQNEPGKLNRAKSLRRRFFRVIGLAMILAGICVIAYPLSTFLVTMRAQDNLRSQWDRRLKEARKVRASNATVRALQQLSRGQKQTLEEKQRITQGKGVFRLIIPKIGLDMIVVEGTDTDTLKLGPGHMTKTVLPGAQGVCVVSGHRTTYGAPFFRLDQIKKGDQIIAETVLSRHFYTVLETRAVDPHDTSFIKNAGESILALTTCTPIHSARQRLVIIAKLQ